MAEEHPDVTAGSSNNYQNWEVCDPERWVPYDYVCVRVDSRVETIFLSALRVETIW